MEGHHFSLQRLRSKAFWLGATLSLATLALLFLPVFAERAISKTHSPRVTRTHHARQQRIGRWIEVDLSQQRLVAWNGRTRVRTYIVSTGKRSTPTRIGTFAIQSKYRSTRMRGRNYNVP
jgi:hypothetical protein